MITNRFYAVTGAIPQGQAFVVVSGLSIPFNPTTATISTASATGSTVIWGSVSLLTLSADGATFNLSGAPIDDGQTYIATFMGYVAAPAAPAAASAYGAPLYVNQTRSRTHYLRPFDAVPYDVTNVNGDHDLPEREDYAVFPQDGVYFDSGVTVDLEQESLWRARLRKMNGGVQLLLTNAQGTLELQNIGVDAIPGPRREGVQA